MDDAAQAAQRMHYPDLTQWKAAVTRKGIAGSFAKFRRGERVLARRDLSKGRYTIQRETWAGSIASTAGQRDHEHPGGHAEAVMLVFYNVSLVVAYVLEWDAVPLQRMPHGWPDSPAWTQPRPPAGLDRLRQWRARKEPYS